MRACVDLAADRDHLGGARRVRRVPLPKAVGPSVPVRGLAVRGEAPTTRHGVGRGSGRSGLLGAWWRRGSERKRASARREREGRSPSLSPIGGRWNRTIEAGPETSSAGNVGAAYSRNAMAEYRSGTMISTASTPANGQGRRSRRRRGQTQAVVGTGTAGLPRQKGHGGWVGHVSSKSGGHGRRPDVGRPVSAPARFACGRTCRRATCS